VKFTLEELLEQKALLERHLAWLERKIVAFRGGGELPEAGDAPVLLDDGKGRTDEASSVPSGDSETIDPAEYANLYRGDPSTSYRDAKSGCLIWIAVAGLISVLAAVGLYVFYPAWDDEKARERLPTKTEDRGR